MNKEIEQLSEEDLIELWTVIGGTPHLFEYGKDELKQVLMNGECSNEDGEPIGLQLDYYTMAAIVDKLRERGFPAGKPVDQLPGESEWEKALISLTAGGSEFVGDPKRCVEYVKDIQAMQHNQIVKPTREVKTGEGLREALEKIRDMSDSPATEDGHYDLVEEIERELARIFKLATAALTNK